MSVGLRGLVDREIGQPWRVLAGSPFLFFAVVSCDLQRYDARCPDDDQVSKKPNLQAA